MRKLALAIAALVALMAGLPLMAQTPHAVLLGGGTWKDLGTLSGYSGASALAITSSGQLVGAVEALPNATGFTYTSSMSAVPGLSTDAVAEAVNGSGEIVGWDSNVAFVYNGSLSHLPCTVPCAAMAVNDSGTIAGGFTNANGAWHAFGYSGTLTDITPTQQWAIATAINTGGTIAGVSSSAGAVGTLRMAPQAVFMYSSGSTTWIPSPASVCPNGQSWGVANAPWIGGTAENTRVAINDSNVVAVSLVPDCHGGLVQAYYYDSSLHQIPYLSGDSNSYVAAINGSVIAGWSSPSGHPWTYNTGSSTLTDLGTSKTGGGSWSQVIPTGINASGQVVGVAAP